MDWTPDIISMIEKIGIALAIIAILTYGLVRSVIYIVKLRFGDAIIDQKEISSFLKSIKDQVEKTYIIIRKTSEQTDGSGNIVRKADIVNAINEVKTEVLKKCGRETCPLFSLFENKLNTIKNSLDLFHEETQTFRKDSLEVDKQIFERVNQNSIEFNAFSSEIGRELMKTLKVLVELVRNGKNRDD